MINFRTMAAVALSLAAAPAFAADMAIKAPVVAPVMAYSWTGCFVGGNVGRLWAHEDWTDRTPTATFGRPNGSQNINGWVGGVQGGCDYQFAGNWVIGIQGDYDWSDASGTNFDLINTNASDLAKIRALASATARVGYAWDRFLGYVRGGGAWERDNYTMFFTATNVAFATASDTRGGWTVGIGGEYAVTNWLSAFAEYDYYDFGRVQNNFIRVTNGGLFSNTDIRETKNVVKVGLNFRWNAGAGSVVAKY